MAVWVGGRRLRCREPVAKGCRVSEELGIIMGDDFYTDSFDFNYNEKSYKFDQNINDVRASQGSVAAGYDAKDFANNAGMFKGIQAGSGPVYADHAVIGDGNTSVQGSSLGSLATNGGTSFNVPGNAVFGSGSVNEIHGDGQVAQGGSSIVDVDNQGPGNLNFGGGTLNDVTAYGNGPVAVDHSSANAVTAGPSGQAVLGNGNKLTGDVTVDMHDVSGNSNLAIGDHNDQSAEQVDASRHFTDYSVRDSYNTRTETDDHSNHSINDSYNQKTVSDSFNKTWESHDDHSVYDSYNRPTTTTVEDSFNKTWDSHDETHTVEDSYNRPSWDSHDITKSVDDSYNHQWDSHDSHEVADSYNHPSDSYNQSWDSHDLTHNVEDHGWDFNHGHA
jgi:hypothetical protein